MSKAVRFRTIDESNISDHIRLEDGDKCLFLLEYTSGAGFSFGKNNSLISNLKKKPSRKINPAEYKYKEKAITVCSEMLSRGLNHDWLGIATMVPVPPSKSKDDTEYDDRIIRICREIPVGFEVDVRELVLQRESIRASHECRSGDRPSVDEILGKYIINESLSTPLPRYIGIVDDVLTTGSHFKAMKKILSSRFPGVPIVGIFIARRVFLNEISAIQD